MSTEQEKISSTGFFRCLLCKEPVEVILEDEKPSVHCSCGLDFRPDVSNRDDLKSLWNCGLIRNIEYVEFPKAPLSILQSGHFYYWLAVICFCIQLYIEYSFSGLSFGLGFFSLSYAVVLKVLNDMTLSHEARVALETELEGMDLETRVVSLLRKKISSTGNLNSGESK